MSAIPAYVLTEDKRLVGHILDKSSKEIVDGLAVPGVCLSKKRTSMVPGEELSNVNLFQIDLKNKRWKI